jgi:signal peptidase I
VIAGVFRTLFFQPFWIPSGSMKETLLIGDFLFVNKMAYGYSRYSCPFAMCPFTGRIFGSEPERGDIVVFRHPVTGADFIKRVIGLPGDRVQMRDGTLYLNDEALPQEPAGDSPRSTSARAPPASFRAARMRRWARAAPAASRARSKRCPAARSYPVLNIEDRGFADNTPAFTVPEGHFFFIGDNRDNSPGQPDARRCRRRRHGALRSPDRAGAPGHVSLGRAVDAFFWTWRSDRFFTGWSEASAADQVRLSAFRRALGHDFARRNCWCAR